MKTTQSHVKLNKESNLISHKANRGRFFSFFLRKKLIREVKK